MDARVAARNRGNGRWLGACVRPCETNVNVDVTAFGGVGRGEGKESCDSQGKLRESRKATRAPACVCAATAAVPDHQRIRIVGNETGLVLVAVWLSGGKLSLSFSLSRALPTKTFC